MLSGRGKQPEPTLGYTALAHRREHMSPHIPGVSVLMYAAARWIAGRRTAFSSTMQALLDHWLQGDMPLAPAVRRMPKRAMHAPLFPTIAQQRLWFLDQLEPGNPAYNVPVAYHVQGRLNVAALAQSINAIVHRHEVLRTTFPAELGCPMQVIAPSDTVHDTPHRPMSCTQMLTNVTLPLIIGTKDIPVLVVPQRSIFHSITEN